ncbi:cysteine biosynthesis protein [Desulfopila sp. IMCC35006]|uniref:EI24 domain-containing protein n=1 Tax=Desulfopila sp. IMCC35006 TaxID=2569542 RepID=UPI0010AC5A0C|nr:EI24 domain-containing protein [Desulfopila sp. IMCC35006]TKB24299.1 cysteine biosynthesis protein [Desulfopila sp. IMCC35006]
MQKQLHVPEAPTPEWIPLSHSLSLIFRRKRLFGWSFLLFLLTITLTWVGYLVTVDFIDQLTGNFTATAPATGSILGWIKYSGWLVSSWLFLIVSRIVAFYLAFLFAYTLSTPGYAFLSAAAEKMYAGIHFDAEANFSITGFFRDLFEGLKIASFGIVVTIAALFVNFIPGIGQALVFLFYTYYSALLFVDYPASRRRWSLGQKLRWLRTHSSPAFRLGVLPALISMIPFVNIFAIALLFPLLTVHTTLNFSAIELAGKPSTTS